MTKFLFILLFFTTFWSCNTPDSVKVTISIRNCPAWAKLSIVRDTLVCVLVPDSDGMASVEMKPVTTGYGVLKYGRDRIPLYITPGADLEINFDGRNCQESIEFGGAGAPKNNYLSNPRLCINSVDYNLEEQEFIDVLKRELRRHVAILDSCGFDPEFVAWERHRLLYKDYALLGYYPLYHARRIDSIDYVPSENYVTFVKSLLREDKELLQLPEYRDALCHFITTLSTTDIKEYDATKRAKAQVDFVVEHIKDQKIREYLIHQYLYEYIRSMGVRHLGQVKAFYNEHVADARLKAEFRELCDRWARVDKGQLAPSFTYTDINGLKISLEELRGHYVFIDIWATWCAPCKEQLPYLEELKRQFAGKNISFISISCDRNKEAWEKMVKEKPMSGIQLHNDGNKEFIKAFLIRGIPRFILIDREGRVISADMTRPSNSATYEMLRQLEGI